MKQTAFIFLLSLFLLPRESQACTTTIHKKYCDKEMSNTYKSSKECCAKKKNQTERESNNCGGKCGNKSCQCVNLHFSTLTKPMPELKNIIFFSLEKLNYTHLDSYFSKGFHTIWCPPNIG